MGLSPKILKYFYLSYSELKLFFGKVRSRGTSLMLNTFSFGAWNLEIFEVEVWKNLTYQKNSKCQAICLNIPLVNFL